MHPARAEGLAVGWVSLFDSDRLMQLLTMPAGSKQIAILCVGHTEEFYDQPMLQKTKWAERVDLKKVIMENTWEN